MSSIHTVRGNIAHSSLEDFYDIELSTLNKENYSLKCREEVQKLLVKHWKGYHEKLDSLELSKEQEKFYFEETMMMLMNWVNFFVKKLEGTIKEGKSVQEAFAQLKPIREQEYRSDNYSVRGFIDAIHHLEEEVHLVDYKTNSRFDIKDSIKLQLAIYCLLYFEKHGKTPSKVGIFFLRYKLKMMNVDKDLLELAKREVSLIHEHTSSTEEIDDYPRTVTPLCKWSTGQCDFYEVCKPHN